MKINAKLFKKSFDLKNSNLYGGRNQATSKETSTLTEFDNCTDTETKTYDDNGKWLSTCEEFDCP